VDVLTYHYDNARDGVNTAETILTPSNVNTTTFGKQFTLPTDGYVYAQPLLKIGVTIPGQGAHDVLYVATQHDSLYAFDAHGNNPAQGYLWKDTFINPGAGVTTIPSSDVGTNDITPEIGITGTPVIDPNTNTIYLDAALKVVSGGTTTYEHTIHAIDLATGAEKFGGPIVVHATVPGTGDGSNTVTFNAQIQNQRAGLALATINGTEILEVAFGSRGDTGTFHGWVMSYNVTTLQPISVFCSTPNGIQSNIFFGGGGIWMAADGIPVDSNGNIYVNTGNGTFDANTGGIDYGDSTLKLDPNSLAVVSTFTPSNQDILNQQDLDYGTGGIILLPTQSGTHPNELITADKLGKIYLLNRDSLGGYRTGPGGTDNLLGTININAGLKDSMAYFNGSLYVGENGIPLSAYTISNGVLGTSPTSQSSNTFGPADQFADGAGTNPIISANGTNNSIAWALDISAFDTGGSAVLYAYNATNLGQMLYNSNQSGSRDQAGAAVKFTAPLVSGGLVYVPGQSSVTVYGLFNQSFGPISIDAGGSAAGSYLSDTNFTGGTTATSIDPVNTSGVTNPAPQIVYDTERYGNFTYTIPRLTAGTNYIVRLHFAEFYWNTAGQRSFNVLINGTQVLTNFDILAAAGGKDIAIVRQFTTVANSTGNIIIQFVTVIDNAKLSGLEILTTIATAPSTPTDLTATASNTQVTLNWTASTGAASYNIYRSTTSGAEGSTAYRTGITTTSFTDTGLNNSTTYYYQVSAVNTAGESNKSSEVSAVPMTLQLITAINAGGNVSGSYLADANFIGGTTATSTDLINTSSVTNPAPQTVYDTERYGNFTYTVPGLAAGASYIVRLHFAEFYWTAAGQRVFNVLINGTQVLTNFDILSVAGGKDIAIVRQFTVVANNTGNIVLQFATVVDNAKLSGLEVFGVSNQVHLVTAINAGGGASGSYLADANFTGGRAYSNIDPINTSGVTNPAPQAVYDSERVGNFTYTIPGLAAGASYTVRLDFAEIYWNAAGLRSFNVLINGVQVLTNFDIFAVAGGKDVAVVRQFTAVADSSGRVTIQFVTVVDNAKLSGLEILSV